MPTPQDAINELLEMSASIRRAVLARGDSEVLAGTDGGAASGSPFVSQARAILEAARAAAREMQRPPLSQLYIKTGSGCLFIVTGDKDTWIAAVTSTDPTVGLVLYDVSMALKTALEAEAAAEVPEEEEGEDG
jgi:predicted regulator of Ras-like GTPase activity (Roadblock/LC7/MglB family)